VLPTTYPKQLWRNKRAGLDHACSRVPAAPAAGNAAYMKKVSLLAVRVLRHTRLGVISIGRACLPELNVRWAGARWVLLDRKANRSRMAQQTAQDMAEAPIVNAN